MKGSSSTVTARKRRRSSLKSTHQLRLSWPSPSATQTSSESPCSQQSSVRFSQANRNRSNKPKRARNKSYSSISSPLPLAEQFRPGNVNDLCLAPKKVKEVAAWLDEWHYGMDSRKRLLILVGNPGIGKSTMVQLLLRERDMEAMEWNESVSYFSKTEPRHASSIQYQSAVDSFEHFLQDNAAGHQPLLLEGKKSRSAGRKSVIVLDDLPYLHTAAAQSRFCNIMKQHLLHSRKPTVLIVSDVVEGKCSKLETWIDRDLLYNTPDLVTIVHINPPTKSRFESKVLQRVAAAAGLSRPSPGECEALYERLQGDARAALAELQFQSAVSSRKGTVGVPMTGRDKKLNTFHALGKLLYAKRIKTKAENEELTAGSNKLRPPLEFDPEQVIDQSHTSLQNVLDFVGYHCVDFFSDVSQLSSASEVLSDAAFLLERSPVATQRNEHQTFPSCYVTGLAGRAVASTNRNPAPTRFRQFTAPAVYKISRQRRDNMRFLEDWTRQTTSNSRALAVSSNSIKILATERLPFIRKIHPKVSLDGLHSFFQMANETMSTSSRAAEAEEIEERWIEQQEILREDDIAEFEESEDDADSVVDLTH